MTDIDYPDLPNGWEWRSGNGGSTHYTRWFGTKFQMGGKLAGIHGLGGYDGEMYWDEGGDHHVQIYPIKGIKDDGDPRIGEYSVVSGTYDTEQEAASAIPELIAELEDDR
jgi:hypothetical protein